MKLYLLFFKTNQRNQCFFVVKTAVRFIESVLKSAASKLAYRTVTLQLQTSFPVFRETQEKEKHLGEKLPSEKNSSRLCHNLNFSEDVTTKVDCDTFRRGRREPLCLLHSPIG